MIDDEATEIFQKPCPHAWQFNPIGQYWYCPICNAWLHGGLYYYDLHVDRLPDDPAIDAVRYIATMRLWKRS